MVVKTGWFLLIIGFWLLKRGSIANAAGPFSMVPEINQNISYNIRNINKGFVSLLNTKHILW